jgi:hypothetical protein
MTNPITAADALRLAREALEDDRMFTLPRVTPSRDADVDMRRMTREPQLARFVEAVLGMPGAVACRVNVSHDGAITISDHAPKMDGSHVRYRVSARHARAIAADLLRAADAAEAKEGK